MAIISNNIRDMLVTFYMSNTVQFALLAGGAVEELELWRIHKEHLDCVAEKGGTTKGRSVRVHPTLLNWCIAFLARTSASVYKEVRRVMKLPSISYVYRKTAEMISTMADKAYAINVDTIREMGERADRAKNLMLSTRLNVDWLVITRTARIFSNANVNTKYIYAQLFFVASSTFLAASDHSVASVTLATALAVITALETLLRVTCLSTNVSTELLGLLLLMHLTKKVPRIFAYLSIRYFVICCCSFVPTSSEHNERNLLSRCLFFKMLPRIASIISPSV